ncbi:hypothetical protein [Luteolibacter sp. LG18]|uniref:hypothetical protein n=1 Tax=Luteolibacter sp. LG18 TaxID=2819286 RepID=UPI0030C71294
MPFILSAQREDLPSFLENWKNYRASLEAAQGLFPRNAYEIAISDWWYDPNRPEGPHDAWLQKLEVGEAKDEDGVRHVMIRIELASAHHGTIVLVYPKVYSYCLAMGEAWRDIHGDWRFDEFSHDGTAGRFTHTIEWADGPVWTITASDLIHSFDPGEGRWLG